MESVYKCSELCRKYRSCNWDSAAATIRMFFLLADERSTFGIEKRK